MVISLIIGYLIGYIIMYKRHEKFLANNGFIRTKAPFKTNY